MTKTFTQVIVNRGTTFTFGKHKGETVREVLKNDPSYITWLDDEQVCLIPQDILDEALDNEMDRDDGQNMWDYLAD